MRGHASGPFDTQGNLRVQKVLILDTGTPTQQTYINASPTDPVLLEIVPNVDTAESGGTNSLIIGTDSSAEAYYASGDVNPETLGLGTIKRFVIKTGTWLVAKLRSVAIAASKVLTLSAITAANGQTVVIGGQTYTYQTSLTDAPNNVLIGADTTAQALNLTRAINAGAGAGTLYGTGTVANASVTAVASTNTVAVTAKTPGIVGNSVPISETLTNGAWAGGATALSGGVAVSAVGKLTVFLNT